MERQIKYNFSLEAALENVRTRIYTILVQYIKYDFLYKWLILLKNDLLEYNHNAVFI